MSHYSRKTNIASDSESSSTESIHTKIPQMTREVKDSFKDQSTTMTNKNVDMHNKYIEATEELTRVADPVKVFQEDMEMEGYTGTLSM